MSTCPHCGLTNQAGAYTCAKCGAPLGAGGGGVPDEYVRMQAERAAAARRKKAIYAALAVAALGLFGWRWMQESKKKDAAQTKLDFFARWEELDKRETGLFWNCVMAGEVQIGIFSNIGQVQQKIEAAYFAQQKTFSEHLVTECVPKMERARQAMAAMNDAPVEFRAPLEVYKASLPKLATTIEAYAERIKGRAGTKDLDQLVQEYGGAWHAEQRPTPETIAFDKFMNCAVPGLTGMKDAQAMLEFLADACYKKDPVTFMDRVRKDCGPLLQNVDAKAAPSKTYKATQKKFYEEEQRQLQAWDSCGRRSRKGKKVEDLGEFLAVFAEYYKARNDVGQTARGIESSAK